MLSTWTARLTRFGRLVRKPHRPHPRPCSPPAPGPRVRPRPRGSATPARSGSGNGSRPTVGSSAATCRLPAGGCRSRWSRRSAASSGSWVAPVTASSRCRPDRPPSASTTTGASGGRHRSSPSNVASSSRSPRAMLTKPTWMTAGQISRPATRRPGARPPAMRSRWSTATTRLPRSPKGSPRPRRGASSTSPRGATPRSSPHWARA